MTKNKKTQLDKLFFYSDPHYGHANVIKFCSNRKYDSIEEMDADFIRLYNETVPPDGTCIWVGDCFFYRKGKRELSKAVMDQLNGTKVLVRGNHDSSYAWMYDIGFSFVCDYMEIKVAGQKVRIKHYPPKYTSNRFVNWIKFNVLKSHKPRYFDRYPDQDGTWVIHGHTHDTTQIQPKIKAIHAGVDAWNGRPLSCRQVEKIIQRSF